MKLHKDSEKYLAWSLESTAQTLLKQFPDHNVLIIKPARMQIIKTAAFSCFDNFVRCNENGTPSFQFRTDALKHLYTLLQSFMEKQAELKELSLASNNINDINLTLIGFSKGCTVLNQLLYEFHHQKLQNERAEINNFIRQIKSMWWLDSGHGGYNEAWITKQKILESYAALKINTFIHVTPYQIDDKQRPWIRIEEEKFYKMLLDLKAPVERKVHFSKEKRSLLIHFKLLTVLKNYAV
ncbi:mitochondrial protein C2orf69-like isoform X2 [Prorops nasuta]